MAGAALDQLKLDKVLWMPTGNPGYRNAPVASGEHRVAMLRLALEGEPRHEIDTRELLLGASGYTVDSLHELRLELGSDASLYFLMGADQFAKLGSWHRPEELARLARVAVFARSGFEVNQEKTLLLAVEPMPVSGTEIRERVARGEDISALVPAPVASYIARHGLYR
jgi:nicotinate-nucleotide adenylyltransferase